MAKITLIIILFILIGTSCFAQLSDAIAVQKKNGKNVKTFGAGSRFNFFTTLGNYVEGYIKEIRDDSVFIITYDIRATPNRWGVSQIDTIAKYTSAFNVNEIASVQVVDRQRFQAVRLDNILMDAGAGYFILNLVNSDYLHVPITSRESLETLGISAGVFGLGLFLHKFAKDSRFSGKKHKIVYVKLR